LRLKQALLLCAKRQRECKLMAGAQCYLKRCLAAKHSHRSNRWVNLKAFKLRLSKNMNLPLPLSRYVFRRGIGGSRIIDAMSLFLQSIPRSINTSRRAKSCGISV
jgi:hypothetical protein